MANDVLNFSRGKYAYYGNSALGLNPANSRLVIVVLEAAEADADLANHNDLAALLAEEGNTEATSTGYARKEHASAGVTWSKDDTGNTAKVVIDENDTWTSVSQADSESWVKLLVCYDADNEAGTDADIIVLSQHDFAVTPNGGDITAEYSADGVWASS